MRFRADIATLEDKRDKILSVCQLGPDGEIEYEVIIQRGPKEYNVPVARSRIYGGEGHRGSRGEGSAGGEDG